MRLLRLLVSVFLVAFVGGGCSAIINPDDSRLLGGHDAGTSDDGGSGRDAGPVVPRDGGPRRDGGMTLVDAGPRDAGNCMDAPSCEGAVLTTCLGDQVCPLGCASGAEARCATLRPSNVPADAIDLSAPNVIVEPPGSGVPIVVDTDVCEGGIFTTEVRGQMGRGPDLCIVLVHDLTLRAGVQIRARGQRALVVLASGNIVIEADAVLDVSAVGLEPGPAGGRGGNATDGGGDGLGLAPGRGGVHVDTFDDGGGGGAGFCGGGGSGGDGGSAAGGLGREAVDVGFLIPLVAGSGGGRGEGSRLSAGTEEANYGPGGAGGGALQLSALGTIRIDGAILAGGGGGRGGGRRATGGANWGAGGGGGSGGAVLLEAVAVTFGVFSSVTTSGGGGGGGASSTGSGTAGTDGRETLGQAGGGASGGVSLGAVGGASGGGGVFNGAAGGDNVAATANGGGGGGAVGCIVVRNANGALPAGAAAHLSGTGSPALRATTAQRQ